MRAKLPILAAVMAGLALPAGAHELSFNECVEGSDFIKHAAMSRDHGLSREEFIGRLHGDLLAIRAFPPELRWFVQDDEDAALLVSHSERVFDEPRVPDIHQTEFLQVCLTRTGEQARADE
jgi:hypothetical protein